MTAWVTEQRLDRSGKVIEQTVCVELDPGDVLALLPKLENPIRHVSLTVKFQQVTDGTGRVTDYAPASARAYLTVGEAR